MGRLAFVGSGSGATGGVLGKAAARRCSHRAFGLGRLLNVHGERGRICIEKSRSRSLVVVSSAGDGTSLENQSDTRKRVIARKFLLRKWLSILRVGLALGLVLFVTALATSSGKPFLATIIVALLFLNVLIYVAPSKPGLSDGEHPRSLLPPSSNFETSDLRERFLKESAQTVEQTDFRERIGQQSARLDESSREPAGAVLRTTRDLYVDTLKADLSELSRVIDTQGKFLAGLEDKIAELTAARDRTEDQNRHLAAENQRLLESLNHRTRRLQDLEETNSIYKIKDRQREEDFTRTEKTAQGLNVDNQQLQIEKKRLLEINSDLKRQMDELNRSLSDWVSTPAAGAADSDDRFPPQNSNDTTEASDNLPLRGDSVMDPLSVEDDQAEKARPAFHDQPEPAIMVEDVASPVSEENSRPPPEMESTTAKTTDTATPMTEESPQGGRRPIDNPYGFSRAEFDSAPTPPVGDPSKQKSHSLSSLEGARALIQEAKAVGGSQATPLFQQAVKMLEDVERHFPDDRNVIWELGTCLLAWGKSNPGGKYADEILSEAGERFRALSRRDANDEGCFFNWGLSLCVRAAQKPTGPAIELYDSASGKYERAVQINPKSRISWFNYGLAIMSRARCMESAAEKPPVEDLIYYYEQAMIRFERAIDLDSSDWKAREYRRICRETLLKYSRSP